MLEAPIERCVSHLGDHGGSYLRRVVASLIGSGIATTPATVTSWFEGSLFHLQHRDICVSAVIAAVDALEREGMVLVGDVRGPRCRSHASNSPAGSTAPLSLTEVGKAAFRSATNVDWARYIKMELDTAAMNMHLATSLHLLYLVASPELALCTKPDWPAYESMLGLRPPGDRALADYLGIGEGYGARRASGRGTGGAVDLAHPPANIPKDFRARRLWLAMCLDKMLAVGSSGTNAGPDTTWSIAYEFRIHRQCV